MSMNIDKIKCIIEAALLAAGSSLSKDRIVELFAEDEKVKTADVTKALDLLIEETEGRGIELVEVATGYRYQARQDYAEWIARLWEERPSRYSRALLETLSLIAYRQPTTRSDIEQVRGVGVSSSIVKTLLEREWIRVVGHRDVPGKPALYATTKYFLDYFGLKSLDELPSLAEIKDLDNLNPELKFEGEDDSVPVSENSEAGNVAEESDSEAKDLDNRESDDGSTEAKESAIDSEVPEDMSAEAETDEPHSDYEHGEIQGEQEIEPQDDEAEALYLEPEPAESSDTDRSDEENDADDSEPSLKPTELH